MPDTATAPALTPARLTALVVMADLRRRNRSARRAATTDVTEGWVHSQTAAWLIEAGLARCLGSSPWGVYVRITDAGVAALSETFGPGGWREELARLRSEPRVGARR